MSKELSLMEELSKKRNKKKRKLAQKIVDDLRARKISDDYDAEFDQKNCVIIVQNNLDFRNSEAIELFNKMRLQMIDIVKLNNDDKVAKKLHTLSETVSELGEKIKL